MYVVAVQCKSQFAVERGGGGGGGGEGGKGLFGEAEMGYLASFNALN